ncbi:MAG TPA: Hsp20/alpha crystallin family protein [Bacteriovoracaceae bacterium]|nr:Hsp20/alpha crystallin family protein [Bacteriovoracaceae bacterium]
MKRMYLTLTVILLLLVWTFASFGQKKEAPGPVVDALEQRLKLREELHRRMRNKILRGFGQDEDLFEDMEKLIQESLSDDFSGATPSGFQMDWSESQAGRTLTITPQTPEQKLDINVNQGQVTIKGQAETKSPQRSALSSFSQAFPVPQDCDDTRVKIDQRDGKILVSFPYKKSATKVPPTAPEPDGRKPISPPKNAIGI